jgi:hypothetical protein
VVVQRSLTLALLAALLLSGCASSPANPSSSADLTTSAAPTAPPKAAPSGPPAPRQVTDMTWSRPGVSCVYDTPSQPGDDQPYSPTFKGLLYDSTAVDAATHGGSFNATITITGGSTNAVVLFWKGAVGPGGTVVGDFLAQTGLSAPSTLISGRVPLDADFVSATSCSPNGGTAHYVVGPAKA